MTRHKRAPRSVPVSLLSVAVLCAAVLALTGATVARNSIYHSSVKLWENTVIESPDKQRPHQNYGQALSAASRLGEALQEFKIVLALPEDGSVPMGDTYREIGVVYFRLGLVDESILSWGKGLQYAPLDSSMLHNIARAYLRQHRYDEALSHARMALNVDPLLAEAVDIIGASYLAKKQYEDAARAFLRYVQLRPGEPHGYWNVAIAMEKSGNFEQAYQYVTRFADLERDERYRKKAEDFINDLLTILNAKKR